MTSLDCFLLLRSLLKYKVSYTGITGVYSSTHVSQSQSIQISKFSCGGMPPDSPSIGMLCALHTII